MRTLRAQTFLSRSAIAPGAIGTIQSVYMRTLDQNSIDIFSHLSQLGHLGPRACSD